MIEARTKSVDPRAELPLATAKQLDGICERFEQNLRMSHDVSIESILRSRPELERPALLRELLALELEYRAARGEPLCREAYVDRFPHFGELVAMLIDECQTNRVMNTASDDGGSAALLAAHPRYRVIRLLGRGGMGSVFLAEHRVMRRLVAIKAIRPELVAQPAAKERFAREITAAARLVHPNIVTAFDAEQLGEGSVLVMEYVAGQDLARLVAEQGPVSAGEACNCVAQAALGMQHAHGMGMVHRDLKPHNLMLTPGGQIKILDFGLAHFASQAAEECEPGMLLGSVDYMAPEQAAEPCLAGIQADIYSLGCTLYFLLTGRPPFATGSPIERLTAHAEAPPPCPNGLPPGLWPVLERMLAKQPADRYQQPREIAEALQPFSDYRAIASIDIAGIRCRDMAKRRRDDRSRRRLRPGMAALTIAVPLIATICFLGSDKSPPVLSVIPAAARRLFEQAEFQLGRRNEASTANAIQRLKEALSTAPEFVAAHVALSNAYNLQGDYGWAMPDDVFPLAQASALRALELDADSPSGHLALAFVIHAYQCDSARAEGEFQRALKLDPQSADAQHWYAWFLAQQSRFEEAEEHINLAARLGAAKSIVANNEGRIRYFSRSYRVAVEKFRDALSLDPDFAKTRLDLGQTYVELGQLDAALEQFNRSPGLTEDGRDVTAARAYALARSGRSAEARKLLADLERRSPGKPLAYEIATIYTALEETNAALAWLSKAFQEKSAWRTYLNIDPRWDSLRQDARFQELIARTSSHLRRQP